MAEPFNIPVLTTERLILRPFNILDLDPFAEIVADPEVMRFATYTGKAMSRSQAWNWLCTMLGHWYMREFGIWGVEEISSGELLGRIGLQFLEWFDDVELVWMIKKSAWNQGFAVEGAREAIEWGFNTLNIPKLSAVIHLGNDPSVKLAERLGLQYRAQIERQNIQFMEYSLNISDWKMNNQILC
jgi:RimJ/RimL family protein N-acetyltransferase